MDKLQKAQMITDILLEGMKKDVLKTVEEMKQSGINDEYAALLLCSPALIELVSAFMCWQSTITEEGLSDPLSYATSLADEFHVRLKSELTTMLPAASV